jgi:O-antigen/teichoic acid export membrane protein
MILPIVMGTTALAFYYLPVYGLFYRRRNGWIPVATLLAAAVNVGLNVILIPRWGGIGAALATLIAYVALLVLVTLVSRRHCRQTLTRREVLELVGLAFLLVPVAVAAVLDASWVWRLPLKLAVNALILAGLWWRGYLTEGLAQVAAVLARLRRRR